MIAIIDCGIGNLRSVWKAFRHLGADARLTRDAEEVSKADAVVLPGVGAFGDYMANLLHLGLATTIKEAIVEGKPYLGICLGLQLLFTESTEFGRTPGLDILKGTVERFPFEMDLSPEGGPPLKIPHMGWNSLRIQKEAPPLRGIPDGSHFYFVHSYYVRPEDPRLISSLTDYGVTFPSSIWKDNIFACQFHPEKSQRMGLRLLQNFLQWINEWRATDP